MQDKNLKTHSYIIAASAKTLSTEFATLDESTLSRLLMAGALGAILVERGQLDKHGKIDVGVTEQIGAALLKELKSLGLIESDAERFGTGNN